MEVLPLRPHLSPLFSTSYHLCVYSNPFASKLQVANYEIYYIIVLQSPYKHRKNAALMSHSPKRRFAFHPFLEWSKYFIQPGKIVISGDHTVNFSAHWQVFSQICAACYTATHHLLKVMDPLQKQLLFHKVQQSLPPLHRRNRLFVSCRLPEVLPQIRLHRLHFLRILPKLFLQSQRLRQQLLPDFQRLLHNHPLAASSIWSEADPAVSSSFGSS